MISFLEILVWLITKYGVWGIIIIFVIIIIVLVRVILDEDRSAAWRARFYKILYKIFGKSEAEKKYIENDICSRINIARSKMPFGKETLPKAIKVKWFEGGKGETSRIKENEIVVRLDPAEAQEKNIVLIASALVKQTALVGIRHILDLEKPLEVSMDLNLVKNLLKEIGDRKILDWFFRNEYQPTIDKSEDIQKWNNKIVEIDERGLFTRLLLVELDDYSKRVIGKTASKEMVDEIVGLVEFLYNIVTKAYGQDVPLHYTKRNIKIGVLLVGKTSKILLFGIKNYLRAFAYGMKKQLNSIYVIIWDKEFLGEVDMQQYKKFIETTENLDRNIQKTFPVSKDFDIEYIFTDSNGKKRKAKISRYIPKYIS